MRILAKLFKRGENEKKTKDAAKERLLLAVVTDRDEESPQPFVKKVKEDIFNTLVSYKEFEEESMEITFKIDNATQFLNINIPLRRNL